MTILGSFQVSQNGDMANWYIPGEKLNGPAGAMDLVKGIKEVVVCMQHLDKHGRSRVKVECDVPLTGKGMVKKLITDLAVFDFHPINGMILKEISENTTLDEVHSLTEA